MLMTTHTTTPQIDAATAAAVGAYEHGFGRKSLFGSVPALALRCAR